MSTILEHNKTKVMPAMAAGDLADLLGAVNEVTSRLEESHRELQAQVARLTVDLTQANHQLERARRLAALGEMAAGIAHEIRNPLGPVRLYAGMLAEDLAQISPKHAELAGRITAASRVMEGIVSDVLTFARELKPRYSRISLKELVESALDECQDAPILRQLHIVRAFSGDCVIDGDSALLRQAVVNIIRNAMEAMADHPLPGVIHELTVTGKVRGQRGTPRAILTFSDTGPGISAEVEARMFNPFYTTRNTGTGLGLAIVHRIVDAHQGSVRVKPTTAKQRGATIELSLPVMSAGSREDVAVVSNTNS